MNLIICTNLNNVIGDNNALIYNIKQDMKHFTEITKKSTVIMGYNTFKSINSKPLKNRTNIVISNKQCIDAINCSSLAKLPNLIKDTKKVFLIGGTSIYEQLFEQVDYIYLTLVFDTRIGDTIFDIWTLMKDDFILEYNSDIKYDEIEKVKFIFTEWRRYK